MTLRKITVDNSVKYIAQSEQTQSISREREREREREKDIEPNTLKNISLPRKQNKKLSQKMKNSLMIM